MFKWLLEYRFRNVVKPIPQRKALLVGLEKYANSRWKTLPGSAEEAKELGELLRKNGDGSINFQTENITYMIDEDVTRKGLRSAIRELLKGEPELALFYFSGHGAMTDEGGFLVTFDGEAHDDGVRMNELIHLSRLSDAKNIVIIIDSCNSGATGIAEGSTIFGREFAHIPDKVSILTASGSDQPARMYNRRSLFTHVLCKGLGGKAKDFKGRVSVPLLYEYISREFAKHPQSPQLQVFMKETFSLRLANP